MSQDQVPPPNPYAPPGAPPSPPPSDGGGYGQGGGPRLPWEDRSQLGFGPALIETTKLLVTSPGDAFSRLRKDGDLTSPILYGLIISWIGAVFAQLWQLLFGGAMVSMMGGADLEQFGMFGATSAVGMIVTLVLWPIFYLIGLFISAGIFHLALMVTGSLAASEMEFEGTLKVVAYSAVSQLAAIVPVLGGLIALVWALVLYVIGFSTVHRTTQGKAIFATLLPVAVICVCTLIAIFGMAGAIFSAANSGG